MGAWALLEPDIFGRMFEEHPTEEVLEIIAQKLIQTIVRVSDQVFEMSKPVTKVHTKWWSKDCAMARYHIQKIRHQWRSNQLPYEEYRKEENWYKKVTKNAKANFYTKNINEHRDNNVWNIFKWTRGGRKTLTPAIKYRDVLYTEPIDKADAFRKELYQDPGPDNFTFTIPNTQNSSLPDNVITEEELAAIIRSFPKDTAPGMSGIMYTLIKWVWEYSSENFLKFYNHLLDAGFHPEAFKKALVVVLSKPNKDDYSDPRAYRLIALIECLGKLLEKVVAKRLDYYANEYNLIHKNQFAGRSGASTTDARVALIHDIQTAKANGLVLSMLNFDIKGYFDFIRKDRLLSVVFLDNNTYYKENTVVNNK
jgi:hypothetical protein